MKIKIILLFVILSFTSIGQTHNPNIFELLISKRIINHPHFKGLVLSDEFGNIVYEYLLNEKIEKDHFITYDNFDNSELSLTLINQRVLPYITTYANLENGSYIQSTISFNSQNYENEPTYVYIEKIESIESIQAHGIRDWYNFRSYLQDENNLEIKYYRKENVLFKLKTKKEESFFYLSPKLNELSLSWEEAKLKKIEHTIELPYEDNWRVHLFVSDSISTSGSTLLKDNFRNSDEITFDCPIIDSNYIFHYSLVGNYCEFYGSTRKLPDYFDIPESYFTINYADKEAFKFSCDESFEFFIAQYTFNSPVNSKRPSAFRWKIVGLLNDKDNIEFNLPIWSSYLEELIPTIKDIGDPLFFRLNCGKTLNEDFYINWKTPHIIFTRDWKIKNEISILSELLKF